MSKVSVIIPIYNVEEYLEKCLDSVINQTYKDLEIICVNDCSPDNSAEILQRYAEKDSRIKIVNREKNGGLSAARNSGLDIATGEYVYFLDSDDWIDDNYISCMVDAATASGAEVVVNTNILSHYPDKIEQHFPTRTFNNISHSFVDAKEAILSLIWNTWAHLWKKSFLDRIHARFPEGYILEDQYFQAVTFVHLEKVYVIRDSVYHYLMRKTSITGSGQGSYFLNLAILNKIIDYYEEHNLKDTLKVKVTTEWIIPVYGEDRETQLLELRKFLLRVNDMITRNKQAYTKQELTLYHDVINDYTKALNFDYRKIAIFGNLRKNILKK